MNPAKQTVERVITFHSSSFRGLEMLASNSKPTIQVHSPLPAISTSRGRQESVRTKERAGEFYIFSEIPSAGNVVHSSSIMIRCRYKGRMLFSPPLLKGIIKTCSGRLAGNAGPSSGLKRPAKQASGV